MTSSAGTGLLPHHAALIEASAIAPDVAQETGYYSETVGARLHDLGFPAKLAPALVIPIHGTDGRVVSHQIRPDNPRLDRNGKPRKYESPYRASNRLGVHPRSLAALADPRVPAVITEGFRKRDAAVTVGLCAIALTGVNNWRGKNANGGLAALPDFHDVALNGRLLYLGWDSDAWEKREVHDSLSAFADWLKTRDALTRFIYLPTLDNGAKCGLDDYLAAGHTRDELLALASEELRAPPDRKPAKPAAPRFTGRLPSTSELLAEVRKFIREYVIVGDDEAVALALWVLHTHAFAGASSTPYLAINSAEMESGKTLLLEVLETLVARSWLTGRVSAAALVRKVDAERPTLLLDESDAAFAGPSEYAEALRGVLNTGYRASGKATVCVGQGADLTVRDFATFSPKAIAGLGKLPDTVRSRSIPIRLKRRREGEEISEWLTSDPPASAAPLHARLAAWGSARASALRTKAPVRPDRLRDRAFDVWRPLLAIADDAGKAWGARARIAAVKLSGAGRADAPASYGTALLGKLRELFADTDALATAAIVTAVNADDDLPFGAWRDGKGLAPRTLATLLRPYGIGPRQIWLEDRNVMGYRRADLADSFARYLPPLSPRSPRTQAQSQKAAESKTLEDAGSRGYESAENGSGMRVLGDLVDRDAGTRDHEVDGAQLRMLNGRPASAIDPDVLAASETPTDDEAEQ